MHAFRSPGLRWSWLLLAAALFALFASTSARAQTAGGGAPPPVRWFDQRGQAADLALSSDGTAWALDANGQVWSMPPASDEQPGAWSKMPGQFQRLRATFDGSVWGIGTDRRLYSIDNSVWRSVVENVLDVAATPDGQVWVLRADGLIVDPVSGATLRPPLGDAMAMNPITDLVIDPHGLIWLLYGDGRLFRNSGHQWEALATPKERLLGIAIGFEGSTLGLGASGGLWWRRPETGGWEPYPTQASAPLRHVALDLHGLPWGVTADGRILASGFADEAQPLPLSPAVFTRLLQWRPVGGQARDISVGADGSVYTLDAGGVAWRFLRADDTTILGGNFVAIAAGSDGLAWALDGEQNVYQLNGRSWNPLQARAQRLAVGQGNRLWGVPPEGGIALWDSVRQAWQIAAQPPAVPRALAVGRGDSLWIIDDKATVRWFSAGQWRALPGIQAASLGVDQEETVYASALDGSIYWLDPRELDWKPATGQARRIAVGLGGAPWAIAPNNQLMASARFLQQAQAREDAVAAAANAARQPELTFLPLWPLPTLTGPLSYTLLTGAATRQLRDIAIGANGPVFGVGGSGELLCFSNPDRQFKLISEGQSQRLGVDSSGAPWLVGKDGLVSHFSGGWHVVPEFTARDVAGGTDGSVWAAGTDGQSYLYNPGADRFVLQPVTNSDRPFKASRIAAGNAGLTWVVSEDKQLFRCQSGACRTALLAAIDVAVASDGTPFALDALGSVQRYNPRKNAFEKQNGQGVSIAVGPQGLPWLIEPSGQVEIAGLILPQSHQINTAGCAAPFAGAPTPLAPVSAASLVATDDVATLPPGGSLNLLANDAFAGRQPSLADVKLSFQAGNGGLVLSGASVLVPANAQPGSLLTGSYQICPSQVFGPCAQAAVRIAVAAPATASASTPGAPTQLVAVAGHGSATISFMPPANTGSSPVLVYTAVSSPGNLKASGTASPLIVTGLSSGQSYTFTVSAGNAAGTGPASAPSNSVVPLAAGTVPGAPTGVSALAGNGQATIGFTPPANDGGAPILDYTVTSSPGNLTFTGGHSPLALTGLSNVQSYTFTVTARNVFGSSAASAPSNAVTPVAPLTVPGVPTQVVATAGNSSATVSFTPPPGGSSSLIQSYTVISNPGNFKASGAASPLVVNGLSNGQSYTFTVSAINAAGTGLASQPSNAVVPAVPLAAPGAPTQISAVAANGQATISFAAPGNNGGSPILSYTAISSPGNFKASGGGSPLTVTGLSNGQSYTFTVSAANAIGVGAVSAASNAVVPATVPGAPTQVGAVAGNGTATISFAAPASNGGLPISNYTVTSSPGNITVSGGASPLTLSGLSNGQSYTFTVTAANAVGTGPASAPSGAVTPTAPATVPGAPTAVSAVAGNGTATISFTAPASTGGSPILSYAVVSSRGNIKVSGSGSPLTVTGLTNGQSYTFTVIASNAVGAGPASAPSSAVTPTAPATVPGAPTAVSAVAGNGSATISFAAPASNGGSPILSYTATSSPGNIKVSGSASPLLVTGLSNGQSYTFTVSATNAVGAGPASTPSAAVTPMAPATVPAAPTQVSAVAGNSQATISFAAPANNGGSPILSYTVTSKPGNLTATGGGSPLTVIGLSNGQSYTFTVTAANAVGNSAASVSSNAVTPASVPGAPVQVSAVAGNGTATISFAAPASNGGSAIQSYTVTSSPGNFTATGGGSPLTVTGLSNGQSYTFTVTATNAVGTGTASTPSNAVTPTAPATVPGAPTQPSAVAGNGSAIISFAAPASTGGSPILSYTVTSSPGNLKATGGGSPLTVTGLTNGQSYTFSVTASNAVGTGPSSAPSNAVTPVAPATVPGAPTQVGAVAGNGQATISFAAPASNGGSAIQSYTVTSSPGNITATGASSPLTVTGLSNGQSYTFTVTATNAVGTGTASAASNAVTPATLPGAPTQIGAAAGNSQATISFTAPVSNGGSAIQSYTVTSNPGNIKVTGTASPLLVTGLNNGQSYTFTVTATNAVGTGQASVPSNAVTPAAPATVPGAPIQVSATAGNGQATISFSAPASNGGSAIQSYTVTSNPGNFTATGSGSPLTVTGLSNGQSYTFTVTASNAVGTGPASAASNAVIPATAPGAPIQVGAVAGSGQATVSFSAPASNGGSAILSYTVTSSPGSLKATGATSPLTVTGLTNGQSYSFTVTASNAVGTSPASASSNAVTPALAPGAPVQVSVQPGPGPGQAVVSFSPPPSDGGSAILSYTATSNPGGLSASGSGSPLTVTGLSAGVQYTFTVTATNAIGTGSPSSPSSPFTPQ